MKAACLIWTGQIFGISDFNKTNKPDFVLLESHKVNTFDKFMTDESQKATSHFFLVLAHKDNFIKHTLNLHTNL